MNTQSISQLPIILVTGASGSQGESVARSLLKDKKFRIRILTRNTESHKAHIFRRAGAELVTGDYNDPQSLKKAMEGCYGVFGVTNSKEGFEAEYRQGRNLVDAAQASGIRHLVLHTLPDYHQLSGGKYVVPYCDVKARLETYTRQLGIPVTFVHIAFYYENFFSLFPLEKDNNGDYYFGFPQGDTPLAMTSVEDLGKIVTPVFDNPESYIGRVVGVVGADENCDAYAAILSKVLNRNIYYSYVPRNVYAAYDISNAEELANMFEVQRLHIRDRKKDLEECYRINPTMQTFEQWVVRNRARFLNQFNTHFEVVVI